MIPLHDDNPTHIKPLVTIALIAACVFIFLWQVSLGPLGGERAVYGLGMIPAVLIEGVPLPDELFMVPAEATLITSMFLHGGWMHLIGNMLYLWIFGNNIEDSMGHVRFVVFYLLCGLAAAFAQAFQDTGSTIPMIGASGAISGVLGAYLLLYPQARVLVLIPLGFFLYTTRIRALWVLGFWGVLQFINASLIQAGEAGVAWWAHVGGFVAGMALILVFRRRGVPLFGHGRERAAQHHKGPWGARRRGRIPDTSRKKGPWG